MATNNPFYAFPDDARAAFVDFDRRFENAWLNVPNDKWVSTPGLIYEKKMPYGAKKARFTLPSGLFKFEKLSIRATHFTHLSSLFADVDWVKYQEGVADDHEVIASDPNFNHWDKSEIGMAAARRRAHATELSRILNSNPAGVWEGSTPLFSLTHNVNLANADLGTQANLTYSLGLTANNFGSALGLFRKHKGMQGDELGMDPDTVILPTDLLETGRGIFDPTYLASGSNSDNRYRGKFKILWVPQLTDQNAWYLADLSGVEAPPILFAMGNGGNLQRIIHGEQSPMFLNDQKLGISYLDRFAAYPGLYYKIHKFTSDAAP